MPTTAVPSAKQPRALKTREKILREATRLITTKGFHDTKLDEVLQAAGVTTGAFFHHFRGKEDLGFAVMDWYLQQRCEELSRIEQEVESSGTAEPLAVVFRWLDATERRFCERMENGEAGCIYGNMSAALCETHDGMRQRLAGCLDEMALDFQRRLDLVVQQSPPQRAVDTGALARYIVAVLEGSIILCRAHRDSSLLVQHFAFLKDHLRQAFSA